MLFLDDVNVVLPENSPGKIVSLLSVLPDEWVPPLLRWVRAEQLHRPQVRERPREVADPRLRQRLVGHRRQEIFRLPVQPFESGKISLAKM